MAETDPEPRAPRHRPRSAVGPQELGYALESVLAVMTPAAAKIWMESSNDFLDGATPTQALADDAPESVVSAARDELSRAFS